MLERASDPGGATTARPASRSDVDLDATLARHRSCSNPQFNKTCGGGALRLRLGGPSRIVGVANTGYW